MIYKTILLITILLAGQIIIPSYGQGEITTPPESPFEHGFTDVKFLNAYFGYGNQKIEVQPGDQNVPFTILFSNVGTEDISGIRGLLSLPTGFTSATPLVEGLVEADNYQVATSGSSFTLTFYVNVDKLLKIKDYSGTVKLTYERVRENGQRDVVYDFNFKVTGKSVLDIKVQDRFLHPESNNQVIVQISNNGTAPLNNVDITLNSQSNSTPGVSNLQNVIIDHTHWNIGTVDPKSTKTISLNIFVPPELAGQTLHIPFVLTYFDAQGNQVTNSGLGYMIVGPASTNFTIKLVTPSSMSMGVMQNLTLGLENHSPSKISDISIKLTPSSSGLRILQDPRWFVNEIKPLESTALIIPMFADQSVENQAVNFDVGIQYTKDGSTVIEKQSFSTYIQPVITVSMYGVDVYEMAGQKNIIGNILNKGNFKGQFAMVTVDPLEGSTIKHAIEYIGDLDLDAPTPFNVAVESTTGQLAGDQKVLVTLTYTDTLLQDHTITQVHTVSFGAPIQSTESFPQLPLVILVAVAAGIGGIVFKIKKKTKKPLANTQQIGKTTS